MENFEEITGGLSFVMTVYIILGSFDLLCTRFYSPEIIGWLTVQVDHLNL